MTAKLLVWIAAGAAAVLVLGLVVHDLRESGAEAEHQSNVNANMEAGNAGEAARLGRAECVSRGMRWDFAARQCVRD